MMAQDLPLDLFVEWHLGCSIRIKALASVELEHRFQAMLSC
jgi:hypothetical protein